MTITPVEYVVSGSFYVGCKEDTSLKALLGTCVGVALYDKTSGIGGLYHAILPEPAGSVYQENAAAYASSGLPLFIEAVCERGAKKERLQACVAGGGLIGQIAENDLKLDIGGRTAEIVFDILAKEKIPVVRSETGGVFSMALSLNLGTSICSIDPVIENLPSPGGKIGKPTEKEIAEAIARIRPVPQVALKIVRMIGDNRYDLNDVAEEIRHDQIIAAKVLSLANSAMIGRSDHIDSIDDALMLLGEKQLLRLVVSASVELYFSNAERGYSQCKGALYYHAIGAAMVAEHIALITGRYEASAAYTAGLLHDIGKIVLDHFVLQNMPLFYRRAYQDGAGIDEAELDILGVEHQEVGGRLAALWAIPENLSDAIRFHHRPERAGKSVDLACIVHLADLIVSRFMVSRSLGFASNSTLYFVMDRLGLTSDQLLELLARISWDTLNMMRPSEL